MQNSNADAINCKVNMTKIYELIGQFVEAAQMIEGIFGNINLYQLLIGLGYDEKSNTISGKSVEKYFKENQDDIKNKLIKIFKMCLGNATQTAFSDIEFPPNIVNGVMNIIKERNKIIHNYFKYQTDFYTNWNNEKYFKTQIVWLQKRVNKARNICDELRKLIGATLWEDRWDKSLGDHKSLEERFITSKN